MTHASKNEITNETANTTANTARAGSRPPRSNSASFGSAGFKSTVAIAAITVFMSAGSVLPAAAQSYFTPAQQAPARAKPAAKPAQAKTTAPVAAESTAQSTAVAAANATSANPVSNSGAPTGAAARPASTGVVVARMGGAELYDDEVRAFVNSLSDGDRAAIGHDPESMARAVRALLANRLVLKQAEAKQWDHQPAIAAQLAQLRDNAVVQTYLQSVSEPPADYPAEADIQSAYEANKSAFLIPRQYLVAQIFIAVPKDADKATADKAEEKAKARLADITRQLKQPNADFAAIARASSDAKQTAEKAARSAGSPRPSCAPTSRRR